GRHVPAAADKVPAEEGGRLTVTRHGPGADVGVVSLEGGVSPEGAQAPARGEVPDLKLVFVVHGGGDGGLAVAADPDLPHRVEVSLGRQHFLAAGNVPQAQAVAFHARPDEELAVRRKGEGGNALGTGEATGGPAESATFLARGVPERDGPVRVQP